MMQLALALLGLALLGMSTGVDVAQAETRYVIDQLVITVRSAPAEQFQRLASIRTGDVVEVLEDGPTYLRVRTAAGIVGWVPKQYLTADTPKAALISQLQQELGTCRQQTVSAGPAANEIAALQQELSRTNQQLTETIQRYNQLLQNAGNVPALTSEVDQLRHRNQQQTTQLDMLRQENEALIRTTGFYWLAAGGGVFFLGWLIGKISRRRRSSF